MYKKQYNYGGLLLFLWREREMRDGFCFRRKPYQLIMRRKSDFALKGRREQKNGGSYHGTSKHYHYKG